MAFQSGGFQSADAAPDDRLDPSIVLMAPTEHFTAFAAYDDLGEAMVAAVAAFLAVGAGLDHSPADQFFLNLQVDFLRNNSFVVTFYIVLQHEAVVLDSGFIQKVGGVGLLEKGITDVFFISGNLVDGAEWDTVDINDVVSAVAQGSKPIISGGKIIYYSLDGTKAVVADVSGYLRVQDLTKKTKKRQYLDQFGNDAHNVKENGKKRGRTKSEFQKATHYIIKKRKEK